MVKKNCEFSGSTNLKSCPFEGHESGVPHHFNAKLFPTFHCWKLNKNRVKSLMRSVKFDQKDGFAPLSNLPLVFDVIT